MSKIRILSPTLLAAATIAVLRPITALYRRRWKLPDGMRRCAAVNLRGEAARFVLSALGLRASRDHLPQLLHPFLQNEPALRWSIAAHPWTAKPRPNSKNDLVVATFAPSGALQSFHPMLEGIEPTVLTAAVADQIIRAYNRTRHDEDLLRPRQLITDWKHATDAHAPWPAADHRYATTLMHRMLRAVWLSFDDSPERFTPPDFYNRKHGGLGALNIVARSVALDVTDLWLQFHHAAIDGCPAQEALDRLSHLLGKMPIEFPLPGFRWPPQTAGIAHGRRIERKQGFFDFTPLLEARRSVEAKLDLAITGRPHLSALLLWRLAHQPEFTGRRFALAVELPSDSHNDRSFTFLSIRPTDYFVEGSPGRLSAYVREFNRLLTLARRRQGPTHSALAALALLPPRLTGRYLQHNQEMAEKTFGTFGVTILRGAEIFLAPMTDIGFPDGFLSIGNMNLPGPNGSHLTSASFAAPAPRATAYSAALTRALHGVRSLFAT